jgi:ABC-type nitrate/sulfonate/bicarbonate transport system ATPase subunit
MPEDRQRITGPDSERGMLFQSYTSFPWLTVAKNIAFPLALRGKSAHEQKEIVDKYLESVGLTKFRDAYPDTLSGGMRQRVALARTLAGNPKILLMDEPFGALDSQSRWQMQKLLLEVWRKERCSVIFVTHDVEEAVYLGQRICVFTPSPGRLCANEEVTFKGISDDEPRQLELKLTPEFGEVYRRCLAALVAASNG